MQKTIFIVDDNDTNLAVAMSTLENQYRVFPMASADKMFAFLEKIKPDLILLDIEMPGTNGFEALIKIKNNYLYMDIPVIFLTNHGDPDTETRGFELGAVDFITKPFSSRVLLTRIKTHLDIDYLIRERLAQVRRLQDDVLSVIADMVESRDKMTGVHIEDTAKYVSILIEEMKERGIYAGEIENWDVETVISASRLHDVGKIAIPDSILKKPGKLTHEEFEEIKTHTAEGERIIDKIIARNPRSEDIFLRYAKILAVSHHERWDGKGYPKGLKGQEIPLLGRIMSLADVYDALVSKRVYKKAFSDEKAAGVIISESGGYFDPEIVRIFTSVINRFKKVKGAAADES